ncbi:LppA family lipoprotein [Mycobacterium sp. NPDC003323]
MNPHPTGALEADLRPKGAAEDALPRYESIVAAIAEDITAVMPGLTWKWNRDPDYVDCTGALADTRGVRVGTRNFLSSSPIPDELWPVVLQVVRDHAAELGAAAEHVYADQPGHHDVAVYGDSGVEIRLLTRGRAVLSAMSDCYLQRRDLSPET